MCHLYCYLQHKMRIFSIRFLSSSYIVITIQYLKALWGRPYRNTIDRRPKIKKTSGKQKKKKQYFPTPLGSLHEKNKKNLEKTKKKKQYFQTLLGSLHEKTKKNLEKTKKKKKKKTNI